MRLIISDASVLIDIEQSELTSAMFSLPFRFAVPDILFYEELYDRHHHLLAYGLDSIQMSGELVAEAFNLRQNYSRPSVNDLLALVLAKHERCQLLTGDKALREVAKILDVEIHGTIWLVEQMISHNKITHAVARAVFHCMKDVGIRLPWGEVKKMLGLYGCV